MATKTIVASDTGLVCECCMLVIANGDDSSCRDYHGHEHEECELGLEANESAHIGVTDGSPEVLMFRCVGCGNDVMDNAYPLIIMADVEVNHTHHYDETISAWMCKECGTNTDYCDGPNDI